MHATSAQVVSALLALSLVAYNFLNTELNQKQERDPTLEEAISITKSKSFNDLILTLFVGLLSVGSSLIVISSFKYQKIQDFSMSISFISLSLFTYTLLKFILRSFLPESVQKNSQEVFEDSKKHLNDLIADTPVNNTNAVSPSTQGIDTSGFDSNSFGQQTAATSTPPTLESSLGEFFINFSILENKIRDLHFKYVGNNSKNIALGKMVHQLMNLQLIPMQYAKELIYLLRVRNSLAHSSHNTDLSSKDIQNWIKFIKHLNEKIFTDKNST